MVISGFRGAHMHIVAPAGSVLHAYATVAVRRRSVVFASTLWCAQAIVVLTGAPQASVVLAGPGILFCCCCSQVQRGTHRHVVLCSQAFVALAACVILLCMHVLLLADPLPCSHARCGSRRLVVVRNAVVHIVALGGYRGTSRDVLPYPSGGHEHIAVFLMHPVVLAGRCSANRCGAGYTAPAVSTRRLPATHTGPRRRACVCVCVPGSP